MTTITYKQFLARFFEMQKEVPSYRLGQHFINSFCKNEEDPLLEGLWEMGTKDAILAIHNIINAYQWDYDGLVVLDKTKSGETK